MADEPKIYDDVPRTNLAVRKPGEASALAHRIAGVLPKNEMLFHCITCGESKSLKFDDDEMVALGYDVRRYTGPCWNEECACMTLVPKKDLQDDNFSYSHLAAENKKKEVREAAEVQAEVFAEKIGEFMTGGKATAAPAAEPGRPPGQRDDLPDAKDLDSKKG